MMFAIFMIGFVIAAMFAGCLWMKIYVVDSIREVRYIKEYRKTNQWNPDAPDYLKVAVIPNEEYAG